MTRFVISLRFKDKVPGGDETSLLNQNIDTEKLETDSIKSETKVALKRLEAKLKEVFPKYADKQTKLEDYEQ